MSNEPIFGVGKRGAEHQKRPPRHVDGDTGERLVHRQQAIGVTRQAAFVAERLLQRLAQRDADVLDGVVIVDMGVALGRNRHIDERVTGKLIEHVIEKTNARRDLGQPRPVKVEIDRDLRLVGFAAYRSFAHARLPLA